MEEKRAHKYVNSKNGGMKILRITIAAVLFIALLAGGAEAATPINACGSIISPGTYVLISDILALGSGYLEGGELFCIFIYSNDVVLDGAGYKIGGKTLGSGATVGNIGVGVQGSSSNPLKNVTIKNLKVRYWSDAGIRIRYSNGVTLLENTVEYNGLSPSSHAGGIFITDSKDVILSYNIAKQNYNGIVLEGSTNNNLNGNLVYCSRQVFINYLGREECEPSIYGYGIKLDISTNNILTNNIVEHSGNAGIFFSPSSGSNTIYNNILYNINNVAGYENNNNIWNTTKKAGTNIINGPYLGGNVWLNPAKADISLTCVDGDNEGICDQPYKLDNNNIDNLPLKYGSTPGPIITPTPAPTATPPLLTVTVSPDTLYAGTTTPFTITVTSNGVPVSDAIVTLSWWPTATYTTNSTGQITLAPTGTWNQAGTITVIASKSGYLSATTTLQISPQPVIANGTITGKVTNASSTFPIANAEVTASGITATTDAAGIYSISIAPGLHSLAASATGYIINMTSVTVTSGATVTRDFALQPRVFGRGDVNTIPGIDVGDVLFTAQFVAGVRTPTAAQMTAADVNPIPGVDVGDVLFVAQAVAGLRTL